MAASQEWASLVSILISRTIARGKTRCLWQCPGLVSRAVYLDEAFLIRHARIEGQLESNVH